MTTLKDAVSAYGASLKAKLSSVAIEGAPEDQLRAPLDALFRDLADLCGLPGVVHLVGETTLSEIHSRPDFAVTVNNALVGFIEIKAPGKGADPRRFTDPHDKAQWQRLKALPNLLYASGNSFSLWQDGELQGRVIVFDGDAETSGSKLKAPDAFLPLINSFLTWQPIPPSRRKASRKSAPGSAACFVTR